MYRIGALIHLHNEEEMEKHKSEKMMRRNLRDASNPLELSNAE